MLLGVRAPTYAIAAASIVYGIAWSLPDTLWFTALQEHIPPDAISRVSSYDWLGSIALRPLGYAVVGPAIASIGVEATLLGAAALFAVVNAATLLTPSVTLLERRRAAGVHAGARPELT